MVPNVTKFGDMKGFSFYPILTYLLYILYTIAISYIHLQTEGEGRRKRGYLSPRGC